MTQNLTTSPPAANAGAQGAKPMAKTTKMVPEASKMELTDLSKAQVWAPQVGVEQDMASALFPLEEHSTTWGMFGFLWNLGIDTYLLHWLRIEGF